MSKTEILRQNWVTFKVMVCA